MNIFLRKKYLFLNIAIIGFLLILPYYVFSGGLFIGGDDSKLLYVYPFEYIKNISLYSWSNFATLGSYGPAQSSLPLLSVLSLLDRIVSAKTVLDYFVFSLPMILGFLYFQKFIKTLLNDSNDTYALEILAGSLFYVLSPILLQNQWGIFLTPVWLVPLIPIVGYYFVLYIKTQQFIYIYFAILWCTLFSLTIFTVPWTLGFVIPVTIGIFTGIFLYSRKDIVSFLKSLIIFFGAITLSQAFWLLPDAMLFLNLRSNSNGFVGSVVFSRDLAKSFETTVLATASGNVIYPLFNLFHRQIAFDFTWYLKQVFLSFYDKIFIFDSLYVAVLFIGLFKFKKYLQKQEKNIYLMFLIAFIFSLFFFTVNIGPLKQVFLSLGAIPTFVMFRNFYDKFTIGYIILYAIIFTFSLVISKRYFKYHGLLIVGVLLLIFINFIPIKQYLNQPVWTTKDVYSNVVLPQEYVDYLAAIKKTIQPTSYILSLPLNIGSYAIVTDENKKIYAGSSVVVKILSDVNDLSGDLSFPPQDRAALNDYIIHRKYPQLRALLYKYNINYVSVTNNIDPRMKKSFLFDEKIREQDTTLLKAITGKEIVTSQKGNYILYTTKQQNMLVQSPMISFQKVNPTEYNLYISHMKKSQNLVFLEPYNHSWNIYLKKNPTNQWCYTWEKYSDSSTQCKSIDSLYQGGELQKLFEKPLFTSTHSFTKDGGNKWVVDPKIIRQNYNKSFYTENADGSINVEMTLYFTPQSYFYLGTIISIVVLLGGGGYVAYSYFRRFK